ncbi:MAG: ATP-NAD kinase family protein [Promethearchaeota archaeon]|nr:MAG: ATP-NAD kinase family protein [Candidatus Lokiarchaeota archaeon]
MGGSVGLKGTDGDIYQEAVKRGATPVTPKRVREFFSQIKKKEDIFFLVAPSIMGASYIKDMGFQFEIIGEISESTTPEDTIRIVKKMIEKTIELLVFCGGDGTARDIYDAIGLNKPVVAIPAGVKMFSSVFSLNPRAAAQIIDKFIEGVIETQEQEVLDINEELVRDDILESRLYGYLKVPKILNLIQSSKAGSQMGRTIEENKQEIAQFIIETMSSDILYLLGPGTTIKTIMDNLKLPKTLLGIDATYNKKMVGKDINEEDILKLLERYNNAQIVISPIGGQGFVFGRGNKQFTSKILQIIGKNNVKIIATQQKMKDLDCLRVDTGDIEIDNMFKGFAKVITGYKEELIVKIE